MKSYTLKFEYSSTIIIVLGFTILSFVFDQQWLLSVALVLGILAWSSRWFRKRLVSAWMGLGHGMGWLNSRIILSVIFFLVLFPLSLFQAKKTKRVFASKGKEGETSNFVVRNEKVVPEDFDQMW